MQKHPDYLSSATRDDRQRKGCRLLVLGYKIDGTEKEISPGIYIQPRFWSARSQRIVPEYPESRQLNKRLSEFRKKDKYAKLPNDVCFVSIRLPIQTDWLNFVPANFNLKIKTL